MSKNREDDEDRVAQDVDINGEEHHQKSKRFTLHQSLEYYYAQEWDTQRIYAQDIRLCILLVACNTLILVLLRKYWSKKDTYKPFSFVGQCSKFLELLQCENLNPYLNLQKAVVLRETSAFHATQINHKKCIHLLTKIMYLLNQGESFTPSEASELFFACTKLFQSDHFYLRRLNYMVLRSIIPFVSKDESLIAISCLQKDIISKIPMFRANALRLLGTVVDASMISIVDRVLRQALVDSDGDACSAALLTTYSVARKVPSSARQWTSEIASALQSPRPLAQLVALRLTYLVRSNDRVALRRAIVNNCSGPSAPRSVLALTQQVRVVSRMILSDPRAATEFLPFLIDSLQNKSTSISFEAAKGICTWACFCASSTSSVVDKGANTGAAPITAHMEPLALALGVLREQLHSSVTVVRFASARVLQATSEVFPTALTALAADLERLVSDPNQSLAAVCVTTLLRAGTESSLDRLTTALGSSSSLGVDAGDELRVSLLRALSTMAMRYPSRHPPILIHMLSVLRDEGGLSLKSAAVDAVLTILAAKGPSTELALETLAEYIEDCEFPSLSVRVLQKLAEAGPRAAHPSRFVRVIFNRTLLEHASVRAAAVSALGRFAAAVPSLRPSLCVLFLRAATDADDEVRDRAMFYLSVFQPEVESKGSKEGEEEQKISKADHHARLALLLASESSAEAAAHPGTTYSTASPLDLGVGVTTSSLPSLGALESAVDAYLSSDSTILEKAFHLDSSLAQEAISSHERAARVQALVSTSVGDSSTPRAMGDKAKSGTGTTFTSSSVATGSGTTSTRESYTPSPAAGSIVLSGPIMAFPSAAAELSEERYMALRQALDNAFPASSSSPSSTAGMTSMRDGIEMALGGLGNLLVVSTSTALTDMAMGEATEYAISVIKFVFEKGLLLSFTFSNKLSDFEFCKVTFTAVHDKPSNTPHGREKLAQAFSVPVTRVRAEESATALVGLFTSTTSEASMYDYLSGVVIPRVAFTIVPASEEMEIEEFDDEADSYTLRPLPLSPADCVIRPESYIGVNAFKDVWNAAAPSSPGEETIRKLVVGAPTLSQGLESILKTLGLGSCEPLPTLPPTAKVCSANLIGSLPAISVAPQGANLFARVGLSLPETGSAGTVHVKIGLRSNVPRVAESFARDVLDGVAGVSDL